MPLIKQSLQESFASLTDGFGCCPILLGLVTLAMQRLGGSATVPISYGIVADVALPSERGKMLGPFLSIANDICATGPLIGGIVALKTDGVAWVFLALLIFSVLLLILTGFTLPETGRNKVGNGSIPVQGIWRTRTAVITQRKNKEAVFAKQTDLVGPGNNSKTWKFTRIFDSLRIILFPDASLILWMVATSYSVYYTFQTAIPVIFEEVYGYNPLEIGCALLPLLGGMTIGGLIGGKLMDWNYAQTARKMDSEESSHDQTNLVDFPIEASRYRYCFPIVSLEVLLIAGYGWAVHFHVHPAIPLIMEFFICATCTILMHTANALLVDVFPEMSSTAYASGQIARCGLSAASVAVLEPLVGTVGRGWYFTMFAVFIGISAVLSVTTSRRKGMKWRQRRVGDRLERDSEHGDETGDASLFAQSQPNSRAKSSSSRN